MTKVSLKNGNISILQIINVLLTDPSAFEADIDQQLVQVGASSVVQYPSVVREFGILSDMSQQHYSPKSSGRVTSRVNMSRIKVPAFTTMTPT
jgi:hypothetical protein